MYEFENDTEYSYYRLEITRNAGANITQLAEIQLSNGIEMPPPPPSDMKSHIETGPSKAYTAKRNAGWTGRRALTTGQRTRVDAQARAQLERGGGGGAQIATAGCGPQLAAVDGP